MSRSIPALSLTGLLIIALAPGVALGQDPSPGPLASPAASPLEAVTTSPSPGPGAPVSIELVAEDITFSQQTIEVPAGSEVALTLTNNDLASHNFALYQTEAAEEVIFQGEVFPGPEAEMTYRFTAPDEPGDYFFRCDVHPQQMTGTFVVTPADAAATMEPTATTEATDEAGLDDVEPELDDESSY